MAYLHQRLNSSENRKNILFILVNHEKLEKRFFKRGDEGVDQASRFFEVGDQFVLHVEALALLQAIPEALDQQVEGVELKALRDEVDARLAVDAGAEQTDEQQLVGVDVDRLSERVEVHLAVDHVRDVVQHLPRRLLLLQRLVSGSRVALQDLVTSSYLEMGEVVGAEELHEDGLFDEDVVLLVGVHQVDKEVDYLRVFAMTDDEIKQKVQNGIGVLRKDAVLLVGRMVRVGFLVLGLGFSFTNPP